ncbi:SAM and SH3 domain-containing protein 1-like isoform X2 [Liolophura sinensis]|uniref:SAM and SH3 domain-containing protein 1-like isoform X2 n=1 Tax=Liolophura sinensis TaxID=3198878 RepID=UPI00315921E0
MADTGDCIVEEWLRSLGLVIYTQSFLDNGYDDLEICKQIGEPDLDAIGVIRPEQRAILLQAVRILKEEGGTAVYFTLEDGKSHENFTDGDDDSVFADVGSFTSPPPSPVKQKRVGIVQRLSQAQRLETQEEGKCALLIYPKVQLKLLLRDKLLEDGINLAACPYTGPEGQAGKSSLEVLALQYGSDLSTHIQDVYDRLEELRYTWTLAQDSDSPKSLSSPVRNIHMSPIYGSHTGKATPPPLPTCPPPSSSYTDNIYGGSIQKYLYDAQIRSDIQPSPGNYVSIDSSAGDKSLLESGTLKKKGWFSRNNTVRRSQKKAGYKMHRGDLNASEITMGDEDRIALMLMVKDGTISTETAVEVVKRFEADKKLETSSQQGDPYGVNAKGETKDNNKTLKGKKKKDNKSGKSQPGNPTDSAGKCEACLRGLPHDYELPVNRNSSGSTTGCGHNPHYLRYHSISQMEHNIIPHSPEIARAMSCSPSSRSYAGHPSNTASPINHYPTSVPAWLYSPSHLRYAPQSPAQIYSLQEHCSTPERLKTKPCGKVKAMLQRTSSKSSIVSSESDASLDCTGLTRPYPTDVIVTRNGDMSYASTNSTVSVSSDSSPAMTTFRCGKNKPRNCSTVEEVDSGSSAVKSGSSLDSLDSGSNLKTNTVSRQKVPPIHLPQGPFLGFARAVRGYSPRVEERDMLQLKSGDIIQVLTITQSGLCRGVLDSRVGSFRYSHVEMITDKTLRSPKKEKGSRRRNSKRPKPKTVEELLKRIGLEHLSAVFLLNGYDHLETFVDIVEDDLNELNIHDPEQRAKLLTAAELLIDYDSPDASDGATRSDASCPTPSDTPSSLSPATVSSLSQATVPSQPASRDSGCYDSNDNLPHKDNSCKKSTTLLSRVACCRLAGETKPGEGKQPSQMKGSREERDFTEEDKEVCAITSGCAQTANGEQSPCANKSNRRQRVATADASTNIVTVNTSGQDVKKHSKQSLNVGSTNNGQAAFSDISESTSSDLSDTSPKKKPKPVPASRVSNESNTVGHSQQVDNSKKLCNGSLKSTSSSGTLKKDGGSSTAENTRAQAGGGSEGKVTNDNQADQAKRPYDIRLLTMHDFLSSIGLPNYTDTFTVQGVSSVAQVLYFKEPELRKIGITEAKHLKKILHAFDWLIQKTKFPSPTRLQKVPVLQDRV